MKQYHDLIHKILNEGKVVPDRTGTGTRKIFGHQMRFNLQDGFPLVTTKQTFFRGAVEELLWFLRGSTDVKELQAAGINFWNEWVDEDGGIGHGYGKQFRRLESYTPVVPKLYQPARIEPVFLGDIPPPAFDSDSGTTAFKVGQEIQTKTAGMLRVLMELPATAEMPRIHWLVGFPSTGYTRLANYHNLQDGSVPDPYVRTVHNVGYYGEVDSTAPHYQTLVTVWRDMLGRCYDQADGSFSGYGGKGVHVCSEWHCFSNFFRDAQLIPGWDLKMDYPKEYSIDKDTLWASNRYAKHTCMWATKEVQSANLSNSAYFTAVSPSGEVITFTSTGAANRAEGLNISAVHRCLNGKLKTHHGWSDFQYVTAPEGTVLRYGHVDQIKEVISSLRHNPFSRRHVLSLWNPFDVSRTTLPPCHGSVIQFDVSPDPEGGPHLLSCQMYQRSADVFLGVPVNIASYSLLTMLIAHKLGLGLGEFIWTGGDCHLYSNHAEQVQELIKRDPLPLPTVSFSHGRSRPLERIDVSDVQLHNYHHMGAIKAPVAI